MVNGISSTRLALSKPQSIRKRPNSLGRPGQQSMFLATGNFRVTEFHIIQTFSILFRHARLTFPPRIQRAHIDVISEFQRIGMTTHKSDCVLTELTAPIMYG